MPNLKRPLSKEENKKLFEIYAESYKSGHILSVRKLAKMFGRNQPRILKEMNRWKGVQRHQKKEPVIKLDPMTMDQVRKEHGENTQAQLSV